MTQFDEAVDQNLARSMKKIRIKVDPVYATYKDFRNINSYEGYVITETQTMLHVMLIKPDMPTVVIPKDCLLTDDRFSKFKQHLIQALELEKDTPLFGQIINATHLNDIETFIKQVGKQDTDILELYRDYITSNENI